MGIRTVRGDIRPDQLGRTDYHEHLLMRSPVLVGDELDDLECSAEETEQLRDAGIDALVELTPWGCGRDPDGVAMIAQRTGVTIVLATGVHREAHYDRDHWIRKIAPEDLTERFVADITTGCASNGGSPDDSDVLAGVIKVGAGYWSISDFERRALRAAAAAHQRTGAPIVCHLELGTAAWEVVELLTGAGVAAERIALAHADRNPDPLLHADLAGEGVYLGYDGAGRTKYWPDSVLVDCLLDVAERGGSERILLGGDVARRSSFRAYGGLPGMRYLPGTFVPRVARAGGDELVETILVANPARFLAFALG
ncbi:aryldialkylphosphatase [Actinobacteria bacterium YIM 96077]|uniref:Aryldialkylphosphatase n=2 Tax=Phytoactinopolyspora halophila TaxID=1981511 RepID=A0A329QT64_9ACTN|nr:aryldialkylphosphatase [Actinobacteria bacterium YIM 96077]RAW15467.1 aryldialkylphosphatase [Phytoactinopolyspora halophila]